MNEQQKIDDTVRYFQRYRDLLKRAADNDSEFEQRSHQWEMERDSFSRRKHEITREIHTMRKIITRMIEDDMDPTMAKLQQDESWAEMSTMWHGSGPFDAYDTTVDLSSLSITTGAIGASGAVNTVGTITMGAMGPSYGSPYGSSYGSSAGANGPGGPLTKT